MAKVNKVFPSPYNGISEQVPELMLDSQCLDMVNCVPDLILGLSKRPPALWLTRIPGLSTGTGNGGGGQVEVNATGWYTVTINSDTFDDIDRETLTYSGHAFMGTNPSNHTVNSNLDLVTTGKLDDTNGLYLDNKSEVKSSSRLEADRNSLSTSGDPYRCELDWDKGTRTWSRVDNQDYWLYLQNHSTRYSASLGVCTNDPRFLVYIAADPIEYNKSGLYPQYPKIGLIWLFAGESI